MVKKHTQSGIMFLALLLFVAMMGVGLALVGQVWRTNLQHEDEEELLYVGKAFQRAIGQYYDAPQLAKQYPKKLSDLILDVRFNPAPKRYLRKIYIDPMTKDVNWGIVKSADGGIMGVYSLSTRQPLRKASTLGDQITLAKREGYSAWTFTPQSKTAKTIPSTLNANQIAPENGQQSKFNAQQPVPLLNSDNGVNSAVQFRR